MVIRVNELFSIIKPEWLSALREKVFYTIRMLGATDVYVKTRACWEQTEMKLGADGDDVAFGVKQSIALAAARTINPCNHTT